MGENARRGFANIKAKLSSLSKKVRILAVVLLLAAVAAIVVIALNNSGSPYVVLFSGLSSEDMTSVQSFLEQNNVTTYRVENSNTITIPEADEYAIRALLVQENYPKSGFAYKTYLDNVGTLSSNSDREILSLYDLQDRIGATIRCIKGVKEATVLITKSQDSRYILNPDDVVEASASVMVEMQDGKALSEELAESIRNFVATAVQNLRFENITVSDTTGTTYSGDSSGIGATKDSSALKLSLENQVNEMLRNNILEVLIPIFGAKNVSVTVSSTVDVSRSYHDETTYEEPEWAADGSTGGEGIIGSKVYNNAVIMGDDETFGGVVGTSTNADLNEYVERYTPTGGERELSSSGEVNYNVDTFHAQRENPGGIVTDVTVAVSINSEQGDKVDALALRGHVARAARISPEVEGDKISVLVAPFYKEPAEENVEEPTVEPEETGIPTWVYVAFILGIVTFIILLSVIIVMRRRAVQRARRRAEELAEQRRLEAEAAAQLLAAQAAEEKAEPQKGADIMDIHSERSMELRMNVRQFAEENPEICAQMVKSWLKGGDERGG